jgi:hypothetical protein
MCLAIVKSAGKTVNKDEMLRAYLENNDGCGLAVRIKGRVSIYKGLWKFETLWKQLEQWTAHEVLIHFRWASAGTVSKENCHPFPLPGGGALIHNGHMSGYGGLTQSDTAQWVETVLAPMMRHDPGVVKLPAFQRLILDSIGHSKMCLMLPRETIILGEEAGHWYGGNWYSNHSYQAPQPSRHTVTRYDMSARWDTWEHNSLDSASEEEGDCEICERETALYRVCRNCVDFLL